MASTPAYMATNFVFTAQLSTANANRDGTGTLVAPTWKSAATSVVPATDWLLKRVTIGQTGDLNACGLTFFWWDGSAARYMWEQQIANPSAASATANGLLSEIVLPQGDWTFPGGVDLRLGITAAPTSGVMLVHGFVEAA